MSVLSSRIGQGPRTIRTEQIAERVRELGVHESRRRTSISQCLLDGYRVREPLIQVHKLEPGDVKPDTQKVGVGGDEKVGPRVNVQQTALHLEKEFLDSVSCVDDDPSQDHPSPADQHPRPRWRRAEDASFDPSGALEGDALWVEVKIVGHASKLCVECRQDGRSGQEHIGHVGMRFAKRLCQLMDKV